MEHIRQIGSSLNPNEAYIVVKIDDLDLPLNQHPSIINHPELFEIIDCEIPEHYSYLSYT